MSEKTTDKRRKAISASVAKYRAKQLEKGRKQRSLFLSDDDMKMVDYIKEKQPSLETQHDATAYAIAQTATKLGYFDKDEEVH